MRFEETPLAGAWIVDIDRHSDDRGFFARSWCAEEFARRGLDARVAQCNISWNRYRGTIRGLHYQASPHDEAKLVRCTRGRLFDVIVDLRCDSATFGRWAGVELSADSHRMLFVPAGFAHGFQTLAPDTEVFYQMTVPFVEGAARGVRWDDAAIGVEWPLPETVISDRDRALPLLADAELPTVTAAGRAAP